MPPCRNAVYELMSEDGLDRKGNSLRNIVNFSDRVRAAAEATQSRRWFVDLPACSHNAASHPTARGWVSNKCIDSMDREVRIPRMVGWLRSQGRPSGESEYLHPHLWRSPLRRRALLAAKANPATHSGRHLQQGRVRGSGHPARRRPIGSGSLASGRGSVLRQKARTS